VWDGGKSANVLMNDRKSVARQLAFYLPILGSVIYCMHYL